MSRAAGVHLGSVLGVAIVAILVTAEGVRSAAAQTPPNVPQAPSPAVPPQAAPPQPGTPPVPGAPPPPPPFAPAPPPGYPPPAVYGGAPPQAQPGGYAPAYPPPPPGAAYPPPAPGNGYGYGYGAPGYGGYPPPRPPEPPPESLPGYHRHDGFFLRFSLGLGGFVDHEKPDNSVFTPTRLSNACVPLQLALGGAVTDGLLLGGVLMLTGVGSPKFDNGGEGSPWQQSSGVTHTGLGVYVDDYPLRASGFHFGGLLALSGMTQNSDRVGSGDPTTNGFSVAAHGGYEWWVGADWGMGIMASVLFSALSSDRQIGTISYTDHHAIWIPSVMGTVTYN